MRGKRKQTTRWEEALSRLGQASEVVLDVETSGLDWKRNHIVGWVFSFGPTPSDSYYLPVRHAGDGNILGYRGPQTADGWDGKNHPIEAEIQAKLERQDIHVTGHNLQFDLKFGWRHGFRALHSSYEDTQVNAALIDEWQGRFNLEFCAGVAGVEAKKTEAITAYLCDMFPEARTDPKRAMGHYWRLAGDDPMAVEYAEGDGITTWQLAKWQGQKLDEQDLRRVWDVERNLIPVLVRMTCTGIKVDEERLHRVMLNLNRDIDKLMAGFPDSFNVRSSQDVRAWCEKHGATNWPLTAKNRQPSFPESWLETHEAGRQIVAVRKLATLRSTFLEPMVERHVFNGRVHTEFHQLRGDEYGTVTGRLSSSDPNLQAASKRNKVTGRMHRSVFVADEGMEWTDADYSQCEPRILAEYSGCRVLIDGYKSNPPVDAHQAVANATGLDRETGKRVNQTLITGGGKGVLVERYKIDPKEINNIWATYFKAMPEIRQMQSKAEAVMRRRGYVVTLLGRRCRLRRPDLAYQALNRLLQGGNADVIKTKLVEMDKYLASEGRPVDLLNNVHDAVSFQHRPENRRHMLECLRIMCDFSKGKAIELDIPIVVDHETGPDWAVATFGPER